MTTYVTPTPMVFTIPSGSPTSQALNLSGMVPVGLYIPAGGWNASSIAFRAAHADGGTPVPVFRWENAQRLEIQATPTSYTPLPYEQLLGVRRIMLETTYTGSGLAQTGARVVTAMVRPI